MNTQANLNGNGIIGRPLDRVDGRLKVTGKARYAAEFPLNNLAYAVAVQSTIARGRITRVETRKAETAPGVLAVITHLNAPRLGKPGTNKRQTANTRANQGGQSGGEGGGDPFAKPFVLQDDVINHFGQYVGVVVAGTFEQARHAARLVRVTYAQEKPATTLEANLDRAYLPEKLLVPTIKPETRRGDLERGLRESEVRVDATYTTPHEHNNPMEPHATIAVWEGPRLTLYDATQSINTAQATVAGVLGLAPENVHVVSPFLGGGFGCKFPVRGHVVLAALAARQVRRPVKLVLARQQMFAGVGYRPATRQRIQLGAKRDGQLVAIRHEIYTPTNIARQYIEHAGVGTPMMYASPHLLVTHKAVPLNLPLGTIMRAPGETPGTYALECALDELADALKLDPIELRIKNEPPRDPDNNLPWSSRSLVECLRQGAARFGWERRKPEAHSMRDGRYLIGLGVASATYPTSRMPTSAHVRILSDGSALVQLAATDIGTGTYTALTQIAADALGIPAERVKVELGDSSFPPTPGSGGSWGLASYGSAVREGCLAARNKVLALVRADARSPLKGVTDAEIEVRAGRLVLKREPARGETYAAILQRHNLPQGVEARADIKPGDEAKQYSMHAFGAQFAEVRVDPDTGEVRVPRFLGAFGAGRIVNPKTARSQLAGGIVMGLGMALTEASVVDERFGHFVNADFAEYHVPVNRDVPTIEVMFVEELDNHVNPLGTKGIGELGIVGAAAAIANAVYHATGKRVRDLPITPDKVL
jgi:xanthine dehydrogenase YagR molybdenum-binding subunit